jgi:hypothetical protein
MRVTMRGGKYWQSIEFKRFAVFFIRYKKLEPVFDVLLEVHGIKLLGLEILWIMKRV